MTRGTTLLGRAPLPALDPLCGRLRLSRRRPRARRGCGVHGAPLLAAAPMALHAPLLLREGPVQVYLAGARLLQDGRRDAAAGLFGRPACGAFAPEAGGSAVRLAARG